MCFLSSKIINSRYVNATSFSNPKQINSIAWNPNIIPQKDRSSTERRAPRTASTSHLQMGYQGLLAGPPCPQLGHQTTFYFRANFLNVCDKYALNLKLGFKNKNPKTSTLLIRCYRNREPLLFPIALYSYP